MIGVDWIVLNIERALRLRDTTDEEAALGAALVPDLLARLLNRLDIALRIEQLLPMR